MNLSEIRIILNEIDKDLAGLFERRMQVIEQVYEIKSKAGLPTYDPKREQEMIERNSEYMKNKNLVKYYREFLEICLKISKDYQNELKNK